MIVILLVIFFALGIVGGWLWLRLQSTPTRNTPSHLSASGITVVSWQPDTATLEYRDSQGALQQVVIRPLRPMVIVPAYEDGQFVKEELALTPEARYW